MTTDHRERAVSIATNAVAWQLYANDGRQRMPLPGSNEGIVLTTEELATVRRVARRVVEHLHTSGVVVLEGAAAAAPVQLFGGRVVLGYEVAGRVYPPDEVRIIMREDIGRCTCPQIEVTSRPGAKREYVPGEPDRSCPQHGDHRADT